MVMMRAPRRMRLPRGISRGTWTRARHAEATNQLVQAGIAQQTERVLENLKAVLEACGASLSSVVKTTVYLKDMGEFQQMNEVFGRYFSSSPPARATIQAARLPRDVSVEIDAIAVVITEPRP
jgi:2-iminobutanoate/2-iminopropanoate deaminase